MPTVSTQLVQRLRDWHELLRISFGRQGRIPLQAEFFSRFTQLIVSILARLPAAIARASAGWAPPKPRNREPGPRPAPASGHAGVTRAHPLPRQEGWLLPLMPAPWHLAACGNRLRLILADPEVAPHLSCPPVRRLLRPLCRMFGISDALQPAPLPPEPVPQPPMPGEAEPVPDSTIPSDQPQPVRPPACPSMSPSPDQPPHFSPAM